MSNTKHRRIGWVLATSAVLLASSQAFAQPDQPPAPAPAAPPPAAPAPAAPAPTPAPAAPAAAPAPAPAAPAPAAPAAAEQTSAAALGPAAPPAGGAHTHDGFYLRLGLGVGTGNFTVKEEAPIGDVDVSGIGPSVELALGGTVAPGLVIGGGIYGTSVPSPEYSAQGQTSNGGLASVSMIGPFVDYYFNPNQGFHGEAAVGYTALSAAKAEDDPYPTEDSSGGGFGVVLGVGYEWWVGDEWSLGALGRVQYVSGSVKGADTDNSRDVSGTAISLLLTGTYH